jgi:hypothetical protein
VEFMLKVILDTLKETTVVGKTKKAENSQVQKLLEVLDGEELSATELVERLGLSHRPTFRRNYLNPALEEEFIEMTIPEKPKSRNQTWQKDGFTIRLAKASDVDDYYFQNYCPLDRKCPD